MLISRDVDTPKTLVLPVYLLVDVSSSMHGSKIDAVNSAIWDMLERFCNEMYPGVELIFCVISYGDKVKLHLPPSQVYDLKWRPLFANGVTAMGAAFKMVKKMIEDKQITPLRSYRPTIILVTDGSPTDSWESYLDDLVRSGRSSKCDRMALGIGMHGDENVLSRFVEGTNHNVFQARNVAQVHEFFERVTKSISLRASSSNPNIVPDDALTTPSDQSDFEDDGQ